MTFIYAVVVGESVAQTTLYYYSTSISVVLGKLQVIKLGLKSDLMI